jgi:TDG/mug DNA glycosylase family protein
VGINPHFGSFDRGVPFSNNESFWYLLSDAGIIKEKRDELRDDKSLKRMYTTKFNAVYRLGFVNIIDWPTRGVSELKKGEQLPGRKKISRTIRTEMQKIACFIGKITYEKYAGSKDFLLAGRIVSMERRSSLCIFLCAEKPLLEFAS